jgi:hypothetical protein
VSPDVVARVDDLLGLPAQPDLPGDPAGRAR